MCLYNAFDQIDHGKLSTNDMNVLSHIAGYVARSVSKRVHCQYCACHLCLENNINVELQSSEYFNLLNSGGLKWPTNFVMTSLCLIPIAFSNNSSRNLNNPFVIILIKKCSYHSYLYNFAPLYLKMKNVLAGSHCIYY